MSEVIEKGWGQELVFASRPGYTGKLLDFHKKGARMSLHFHRVKDESWLVYRGAFLMTTIDLKTGKAEETEMTPGDTMHIPPGLPHRLEALMDNSVVIEVSTPDDPDDNYRIAPGDSQA